MNFSDAERTLDLLPSDSERATYLKNVLPRLRGKEYLAGIIALANIYSLQRKFADAAQLYEKAGMIEEAKHARSRIS